MKETTTTIVTTEVIRRAPRKKTISKATHSVVGGEVLVTATYAPQRHVPAPKSTSKEIPFIGLTEAKSMVSAGILAPGKDEDALGTPGYGLAETLLHMAAMRDGLMKASTYSIGKEDKERLQIIAGQLNEFLPIIKDVMLKHVSDFAESISIK